MDRAPRSVVDMRKPATTAAATAYELRFDDSWDDAGADE